MAFAVTAEPALQDDVRTMVEALTLAMTPLHPPEFQFQMTAEEMDGADCTVFLVRDPDGAPVGMGCLKQHDAKTGEVKRMFAEPERRGQGIGAKVLAAIVEKAQALGLAELVLETGTAEEFAPAWRLYERAGFSPCGAVLDYPSSDHNRFYRKALSA
ncbi:GNAT family N-acetyltransferase [Notoacmeibacter sp. MSK16QG-6]|uniref:GNAT family N-acetyltransferase n=1 Tax=Notoacmeibacter sp. MSK16QG-6 TaxID=2957982 RepID=UPI00209D84E7|nr:GNAT family N-acetyltransferase [Notoacmeibacter sp. MSK16QG-6]MCP1197877.1 GNAT family N-acetyltransferase [Notoacmeibacter sp. MSK16QG-6]